MIPLQNICSFQVHCTTCRDLDGGRAWRASLIRYCAADGVDFPCPQGKAWGEITPIPEHIRAAANRAALTPSTPPRPSATIEIPSDAVERCHHCETRTCPNVTACCGGRVSVHIVAPCPDGRW